ncbi:putative beta-lysine N-acetyltransferase [Alkalihalobacillus sp. BA299]|uniref:putative beta-lysine N-acetyltransferase n=1 Tax=Alkalihalobacillus sp. BA299 TaxID=2815938 RepID=UPI001AD98EDC|nr:putative beta-lysine N-acetyltransferase [Alkalihalobacillus sp. BA299]
MKNNINIEVDTYNDRIVAYFPTVNDEEVTQLLELKRQYRPSKIIVYVVQAYVTFFIQKGYEIEGKIIGFFNGIDGFVISYFSNKERKTSKEIDEQHKIVSAVHQIQHIPTLPPLEEDYALQIANIHDAKGLVQLYQTVFQKYPTKIFDEDYVKKVMNDDYFFVIIKHRGKIVSAASAMINNYRSAEITDCATDPTYRGKQFLLHIITKLEQELINRNVYYAYSLTRALSAGMNVTIKRLGYEYGGKLINNCIISTGYEDMCVWSKPLR